MKIYRSGLQVSAAQLLRVQEYVDCAYPPKLAVQRQVIGDGGTQEQSFLAGSRANTSRLSRGDQHVEFAK